MRGAAGLRIRDWFLPRQRRRPEVHPRFVGWPGDLLMFRSKARQTNGRAATFKPVAIRSRVRTKPFDRAARGAADSRPHGEGLQEHNQRPRQYYLCQN